MSKEIPDSWTYVNIKTLGGTVGGKTPSKAIDRFWRSGTVSWISPKDMKRFDISKSEDLITVDAVTEAGMRLLSVGSILMVTRSGILAHTFPVAIAKCQLTINQDIKAIEPLFVFDSRYLAYALRASEQRILDQCKKSGTTVASVELNALENFLLPLAPKKEQERIAEKIDTVLARVDSVNARLALITSLLKRFRQSVLAAATSGRLTEDWREVKSINDPWVSIALAEVASDFSYGSAEKSSKVGLVPVLRMGNIQDGILDWADLVYTSSELEILKYNLRKGDVLFNRTNSPELVGKSAVYKGEREAVYAGYLIKIRCSDRLLPDFLNFSINGPLGREYCRAVKSDGVSQSNINAKKIAAFRFNLPSVAEQIEIVDRVGILLAFADRLEARLQAAQNSAARLTPSLLAKAFRGELVPQDPDDEPAAELLKRLAEARLEGNSGKKNQQGRSAQRALKP